MDLIAIGIWEGWWNKDESWRNKWKNGDPLQGERFLGSSTVFVWATDGWHFFQSLFLNMLILGLLLLDVENVLLTFVVVSAIYKTVFEITYRILK